MDSKWNSYLAHTKDMETRLLLIEALSYVKSRNNALDLGCGVGADTRFLHKNDFTVTSVDRNPEILKYLESFNVIINTFDTFSFPFEKYDMVNAQYALPFNPRHSFEQMFKKLTDSLKPEGIFTGQFFGKEDSWANNENMTFHTKNEIENLLIPYKIYVLREEKEQEKTALGEEKFWHVFHVIAGKK